MKEYFSHDFGARNDPKMLKVLMRLGQAGKGAYWDLIEMLYEQDGYLLLSECESIAFALRMECDAIMRLVTEFDLFQSDAEKFWSESVLRRLELRRAKSAKAAESASKRWNKSEGNANAMRTHSEGNAIKEKEKKGKESKEEKEETTSTLRSEVGAQAEESSSAEYSSHTKSTATPPESPDASAPQTRGPADVATQVGKKHTRHLPPTEAELLAFMLEHRPHNLPAEVERVADKCFAYYTSNGWQVGRKPMKDWHGCAQTFLADLPKLTSPAPVELTTYRNQYNPPRALPPSQVSQRQAAIAGADARFDMMAAGQDPYGHGN